MADSLPLLSVDAERAAKRLIAATMRGAPEVILTPAAKLGARVHGLAPAITLRLLILAARLLPSDGTPRTARPGYAVSDGGMTLRALTTLTRRVALRTRQHGDPCPILTDAPNRRRAGYHLPMRALTWQGRRDVRVDTVPTRRSRIPPTSS